MKRAKKEKVKIMLTGGHLTPAVAVIEELQKDIWKNKVDIVFVGRKYALDSEKVTSLEYNEIRKRDIPFKDLKTGRVTRILSWHTFVNILKIPIGFFNALSIIRKERPDVILTFGSYLGVPISYVGYLFRIPVYAHDQTIHPGLANNVIARVAKKVFISFPESRKFFSRKKVMFTGNPVRKEIFEIIDKPFTIKKNKPVLYITGGALGSHSINVHIEAILKQLLEEYIVIHQTGNVKQYGDFERITKLRESLDNHLTANYFIKSHFSATEIGYIYSVTDLVIGRSGANTFFELIAMEKPALFIPLPWSAHHEQQQQAAIFKKAGTGEIFDQNNSSIELLHRIDEMLGNVKQYKSNFTNLKNYYSPDAATSIVQAIFT